jgi:hypothetical protein
MKTPEEWLTWYCLDINGALSASDVAAIQADARKGLVEAGSVLDENLSGAAHLETPLSRQQYLAALDAHLAWLAACKP